MLPPTVTLFGQTVTTYTALLALAIVLLALVTLWRTPLARRGAVADTLLGGLIGGLLLARAGYVLLYAAYFQVVPQEALQWSAGGLNWHGAVVGAVLGMALIGGWRGVPIAPLLDRLAWGLPLVALAGWWGCETALCAYGAEVARLSDYPSWQVWEAMDGYGFLTPRFHTQFIGMLLALGIGVVGLLPILKKGRFWALLMLFSLSMFIIGFARGDYAPVYAGVRVDNWWSIIIGLWAGCMVGRSRRGMRIHAPQPEMLITAESPAR